jgi:hypothetical protein
MALHLNDCHFVVNTFLVLVRDKSPIALFTYAFVFEPWRRNRFNVSYFGTLETASLIAHKLCFGAASFADHRLAFLLVLGPTFFGRPALRFGSSAKSTIAKVIANTLRCSSVPR